MLKNIDIILVETSHPGNIGSAARACKVMGIKNLKLVNPKEFPSDKAGAMATNAIDILNNAKIYHKLEEALVGYHYTFATSARLRHIQSTLLDVRAACNKISTIEGYEKVAIVFGRERTGLTNEELSLCKTHINIPTSNEFSSLNIASAVQIVTYELLMSFSSKQDKQHTDTKIDPLECVATHNECESFYKHLEEVMVTVGFLDKDNPKYLMQRLRSMYSRANISKREINILRGILTETQKNIHKHYT